MEDDILAAMARPTGRYWIALSVTVSMLLLGAGCWTYQIINGIGNAGITNPVGWGTYITNFVFWVGIAHSGTLISAVLFLFRAKFRSRFNRSAEAMTIFAVMTAGLFPIIHLGRPWMAYWLFPYPNQRMLWVNFRSPLIWDVFAITTYLTVSVVFFYVGLIPDLAIVRRKAEGIRKWLYSALSLGWAGTREQWRHHTKLYVFLAAFATPLVVSVHSVVSWDFAMSLVPGWHTTIFAPYFVAGAIFSGTAMVISLVLPMRNIFGLQKHITVDHFELLAKLLLVTSLVVSYSYVVELFLAWYSGRPFETAHFAYRLTGDYRYLTWTMLACNSVLPLTVFVRRLRRSLPWLFVLSILVNVGMWLERFVIIVTSLAKDFDPYVWGLYFPRPVEVGITVGAFGLFLTLFLLFAKLLPVIAMTEVKEHIELPDKDAFLKRLAELKAEGVKASQIEYASPIPVHEADVILTEKQSRLRFFTLAGALTGLVTGFAFPIFTVIDWPLITGGKPLISLPPFTIIGFELTILFGALASFAGFLVLSRLPSPRRIAQPVEHGNEFVITVSRR